MSSLRFRDFAFLVACCAVLSAFPILFNRTLSTHETTHCQNVREMRADGDWLIPHYGGRVWLERPPLPFWLTIPVLEVVGDSDAGFRVASALAGCVCVLLVAWMASVWYGRGVGVLAGIALATLGMFNHYAAGPEAEIFLCAAVAAASALFVHVQFRVPRADDESWLIGKRAWSVLALFVVLGMVNWFKGLFFGDAFILAPAAVYLLCGEKPLAHVRRYVWLPGWLAFVVVGGAWATAAYLRQPDVVELWFSDYGGRLNQGFMREPIYYYLPHLPWAIFPWAIPAFVGLAITAKAAFARGRTPERFLWCWALAPLVFLSIPQGKHQHYLLAGLAPWAVFAALGAVRLWQWLRQAAWNQKPWPMLFALSIPGAVVLLLVARKYGLSELHRDLAIIGWTAAVFVFWFASTRRDARQAAGAAFVLAAGFCWLLHAQPRLKDDRYAGDRAFVREVKQSVPDDARLLVLDDWGPLDASWLLYYLDGRAGLLHNATFLFDERIHEGEVFVVARRLRVPEMAKAGACERLFESAASRAELSIDYRLGLYRVRLDENRPVGSAYVSPMQATGRAPGPWLKAAERHSSVTTRDGSAGGK